MRGLRSRRVAAPIDPVMLVMVSMAATIWIAAAVVHATARSAHAGV